MFELSSKVPPFCAASTPLLVMPLLAASVMVPPATSALIVPLLVSVAAPPLKLWPPKVPVLPRTVMPEPITRSPASRLKRLLPFASVKKMLPLPLMV